MKHGILKFSLLAFTAILSSCGTTKYQEIGFGGGQTTNSTKTYKVADKLATINKLSSVDNTENGVAGIAETGFDESKMISEFNNQPKIGRIQDFEARKNSRIIKKVHPKIISKFGLKVIKRSLNKDSELVKGFFTAFSILLLISALMFIGGLLILISGQWELALILGGIGYYGLIVSMIVGIITLVLWLMSMS